MDTQWLRRLLDKGGFGGLLVIGAFLLLRLLWLRKRAVFVVAVLGTVGWLLLRSTRRTEPPTGTVQRLTAEMTYSVTDLGTLAQQPDSGANDINDKGQVVGWSGVQYRASHGFVWYKGKMRKLRTPRGKYSAGVAINDKGYVAGWSGNGPDSYRDSLATLWKNGRAQELGTLPDYTFSSATGINNRDEIVGSAYKRDNSSSVHAFIWKAGHMMDLGTLPDDDESEAYDINDSGQIVGYSRCWNYLYAYLYQDGQMRLLYGLSDGRATSASAINNSGVAVGTSSMTRRTSYYHHGCLWQVGQENTPTDLGTLGGGKSAALDINDKGQVVGWSYVVDDNSYKTCAFLWQKGKLQNLNDLIPSDSGWILELANAINNHGQIVGTGQINGNTHAFLLTPTRH